MSMKKLKHEMNIYRLSFKIFGYLSQMLKLKPPFE